MPAGRTMITATDALRPGRQRVGEILPGLRLPRTVAIVNLVAVLIGGGVGLALGAALGSMDTIAITGAMGALAGWGLVEYSPLKNESLLKWFELRVKTRTRERFVDGQRAIVAVGVAVVRAPSSGSVRLARSAVHVPAGAFDERGAPYSAKNGTLAESVYNPHAMSIGGEVLLDGLRDEVAESPGRWSRRREAAPVRASASAAPPALSPVEPDDYFAGPARKLED